MKRFLLAATAALSITAHAQTTTVTAATVTLSNGQVITLVPVTPGGATTPSTPTTPSQPSTQPTQTVACGALSLGKDANTNGFLSQSIPEFNQRIDTWPVDAVKTAGYQKEYCDGGCDRMHLDNTIPYQVIAGGVPNVQISFQDKEDSDAVGYPMGMNTSTEGGIIGTKVGTKTINSNGDHHALVIDRNSCTGYEVYQLGYSATKGWTGYAGVAWDMTKPVRRTGKNSADLAGLPIWPLLVKYNEANAGAINHAFRVTCNNTNGTPIPPATHASGNGGDSCYPGMRLRLKASFDISKYPPRIQAIMQALKSYGAFVGDNGGNLYMSADDDPRWNSDEFFQLGDLNEGLFEVVTAPGGAQ